MKPLANGGIGDTETIPASTTPRLVFSHPPVVLVLAPCLDPSNSCLAIASATRHPPLFSFPSALVDIPPVKIPTPTHCTPRLQVPSDLNIKLISFPLRAFACARPTFSFPHYYRPLWPRASPLWLPVLLFCLNVSSCAPSRVFSPSPSSLRPLNAFHLVC